MGATGAVAIGTAVLSQMNSNSARSAANRRVASERALAIRSATSGVELAHMNASSVYRYAGGLEASVGKLYEAADQMQRAALQSREIAGDNANLIRREGGEDVRRATIGQEFTQGLTLAYMGGSGARIDSGSNKLFFENMQDEDKEVLRFMRAATQSRASIEEARGDYESQIGIANANSLRSTALASGAQARFLIDQANLEISNAQFYLDNLTGGANAPVQGPPQTTPISRTPAPPADYVETGRGR